MVCASSSVSSHTSLAAFDESRHTLLTPTRLARLPPKPALGPLGGALDLRPLPKISCASFSACFFLRPGVRLAIASLKLEGDTNLLR